MKLEETYKEHFDLLNELGIVKKLESLNSKSRFLDSIIEIVHELNKHSHFSRILSVLVRACFENVCISRVVIVYSTLVRGRTFQSRAYENLKENSDISEKIQFESKSPIIKSIKQLTMATHYKNIISELSDLEENPLELIKPVMIIPMKTQNFFVGFMAIGSDGSDKQYSIDEIKYLSAIADFASKAIEDSRLKKIMTYDGKSLLLSYDYFIIQLTHELEKSMRYNLPFCLALGDIDHFTQINDSCGYGFGDRVIRYVGSLIKSECRNVDIIAGYSGAKFAILMPNTQKDNGLIVLERIRKKLARQNFTKRDEIYKTTISFGMVAYPDHKIIDTKELFTLAESMLLLAKQNGRNMVISEDSSV